MPSSLSTPMSSRRSREQWRGQRGGDPGRRRPRCARVPARRIRRTLDTRHRARRCREGIQLARRPGGRGLAGGSQHRAGRVLLAARPIRLRQDHHPEDDRRIRGTDPRAHPAPRPRGHRRPAQSARCEPRLPELRALPTPGCRLECSLRAAAPRGPRPGAAQAGRRDARARRAVRARRPAAPGALRRPAATGRARQGAGEPAAGPAAGRTARSPRPETAPDDADRAQANTARGRHHVRVRDTRPERGAHDVGPDSGDEQGPRRAARCPPGRSTKGLAPGS